MHEPRIDLRRIPRATAIATVGGVAGNVLILKVAERYGTLTIGVGETVLFSIIGALRSFDLISVMTSGGPYESSTVLAYYAYDQAIKYYRQGYSAAVAVTLFAIMLVYIIYQLRRMLRDER